MESQVNPWVRANMEQLNPETLALIPEGQQPEYIRIMRELAHFKSIAGIALGNVYEYEEQRRVFFEQFIPKTNDLEAL